MTLNKKVSVIDALLNLYLEKDLSTNDVISNVLFQLYLNKIADNLKINIEDYNSIFNYYNDSSFIKLIEEKFNYNLYKLNEEDFSDLKEILIKNKNITYDNVLEYIKNYFSNDKDLSSHYKNISEKFGNKILNDYIINLANPKSEKIANICSGLGDLLINIKSINDVFGFEQNEEMRLWSLLNIFISTNKMMDTNILLTDVIHDNGLIENYDLIISEFPINIRNIIHANCCTKIKNLKIRGTKSEPLILQLVMTSLNKNGRAILKVPDNLLYNESKQHIVTRKYLFENFNIKKVISINKDLENIKNNKTSLLYIEKKGKTEEVVFSKIYVKDNKITEKKNITINENLIIGNNYILYNDKYKESDDDIKQDIDTYKLKDLVNILDLEENISSLNNNYILLPLHISENKKIEINFDNFKLKKDTMTIVVKDSNKCLQKYINYYILQSINNNIFLITTGKLNKLSLEKLYELDIKVPSLKIQQTIINYFDLNYRIIDINNQQIQHYTHLKKEFIKLSENKFEKIKLKTICTINSKLSKNNTIMIQKNSNSAGKISLSTINDLESTNIYYLNNVENNFNEKCLYHILKNNEEELFKLANLTSTINLNRTNLENFEIPNFFKEIQEDFVVECNKYDSICLGLIENNKIIISKNIINTINKIVK